MLRCKIEKSTHRFKTRNEQLDIVSFEIFYQILYNCQCAIRINYFEFSQLTDILQISTFLVVDNIGRADTLSQFIVLSKYSLHQQIRQIFMSLANDGCYSAQIPCDKLILLTILENILGQHFSCFFVVYTFKCFDCFVTLGLVLATVQLFFELFIFVFACCLVLRLAELRQLCIQLFFKFVLENFNILHFVYVLLHNVLHLDQLLFILSQTHRRTDRANDILELSLGENEFFFEFVIGIFNIFVELPRHSQVLPQLVLKFLDALNLTNDTSKAASRTELQLLM